MAPTIEPPRLIDDCEAIHREVQRGQRWAIGLLVLALLVIGLAMVSWGTAMAVTNGQQTVALEERQKAEERILQKLDKIEEMIRALGSNR